MSHALQTKKLLDKSSVSHREPVDDPLAREYGWGDVASGLNRVLLGYLLSFVCVALMVVLGVVAALWAGKDLLAGNGNIDFKLLWIIMGGIGLISILSIASYVMILTGKVRCAVHTPDRCGARWMIFMCILCLVVSPVLNVASSFIGPDKDKLSALQEKMMEEDFDFEQHQQEIIGDLFGPTIILSLVGTVAALLASVFFVLYFRAIGVCFKEDRLINAAEFYLIYSIVLIGASGFMIWAIAMADLIPLLILFVLVGWMANLVWYVFLVFFTRCVILTYCNDYKRGLQT